ncbi:MAG: UDP-N-acetylglucosamine 2-epimerase (non-hydrolyzing) [Candidatus Krumholzibacteriota bacterium]|nr:UDP-N-acetylglucosamine 2-epimerase (non-hydrolyzing) [Candidatus Krumholzibacteriota bacterium]
MKVVAVVGTRPEAIKMAPVYLKLKSDPRFEVTFVVTAQNRQMFEQVLSVFDIKPDIDLNLMEYNQTLADITAKIVVEVQKTLMEIKPAVVLVHGDTTTCLCSTLAAFYQKIPTGHVEAGLRSHNFQAPWPEEMNRRLTDAICRWCFAPTESSAENLKNENVPQKNIFITGNTVIDALLLARDIVRSSPPVIEELPSNCFNGKRIILVTGHRRENFGETFEQFCMALRNIVDKHVDTLLVYPVHLNPNVRKPVSKILEGHERIHLIEPVEYLSFIYLMDKSYMIITDSGGIQEEAPSLGKPVLVTREVTERPEAIQAGPAELVGTDRDTIVKKASALLEKQDTYNSMVKAEYANPYGDGKASEKISDILFDGLSNEI